MLKYTIRRILLLIPVVLGAMAIVFFFQAVSTDDPALSILGTGSTQEEREELREELGLNDPILVQFGRYILDFVTKGDLGTSYQSRRSVTEELLLRFPYTLKLAFITVLSAVIIGVPLGILATVKQYKLTDSTILGFSVLSSCIPSFWFALLLIQLFAVKLGWVPTSGVESWKSWILPTIVVAVGSCSIIIRTTRSAMLESIRQDFVRTVRAKGQKENIVIFKYVFRNSLIPIVAAIGNSIGAQLGGALIVESIFGIPGIGKYAVDAIGYRDYPAVRGAVIMLAIVYTLVNLIIDLVYTFVDPRIRTTFAVKSNKERKSKAAAKEV